MKESYIEIIIPKTLTKVSEIASFVNQQLGEKLREFSTITGRRKFRHIELYKKEDSKVIYLVTIGEILEGEQYRTI